MLRAMGQTGKDKQRRVRIVPNSRSLFVYYVSRTTHDVLIIRSLLRCKDIIGLL